jgi:hypothetical protein
MAMSRTSVRANRDVGEIHPPRRQFSHTTPANGHQQLTQ